MDRQAYQGALARDKRTTGRVPIGPPGSQPLTIQQYPNGGVNGAGIMNSAGGSSFRAF